MDNITHTELQSLVVGASISKAAEYYQVVVISQFTDNSSDILDRALPDGSGGSVPQIWFGSPGEQRAVGIFDILRPTSGGQLDGAFQATIALRPHAEAGIWEASIHLLSVEVVNSIVLDASTSSIVAIAEFAITVGASRSSLNAISTSASSFVGNNEAGAVVTTLNAADSDFANSRLAASFNYNLVSGIGDTDDVVFTISGNELNITSRPTLRSS